jgi:type IV fimbrial biogenesis protein FimT
MLKHAVRRRQRGVTIVELTVTVALAAILVGAAVPSYSAWQGNSRIRASADTIHAGLRLARAEAVTRNTSVTFTLAANGNWTVGCATVTSTCPATIHSRPGAEVRGSMTLVMTQQNNQTVNDGAASVTFNSRGVPDAADTSLRRIDLDVPASIAASALSRDLRIVLNNFGQTRLCDPNASDSSPTSCS